MAVTCQLCEAVADATQSGGPARIENFPIKLTDKFLLVPSVGPLFPGQSLIVSRQHFTSLGAMGAAALNEYDSFVKSLLASGSDWLEAEHGSTEDDCAGACVTHMHVHLVPNAGGFQTVFDDVLPLLYRGSTLELPAQGTPYILLRANLGEVRVFDATGLPSQMLRQVICGALGRPDWDWRSIDRAHLIQDTLAYWRTVNESAT